MTDKASTSVTSITEGYPIEGQSYTLGCDITDGNPSTTNDYEWKKDGIKEGERSDQLTIADVDRGMQGDTYKCAADNGAGMGDHSSKFTMNVWCK